MIDAQSHRLSVEQKIRSELGRSTDRIRNWLELLCFLCFMVQLFCISKYNYILWYWNCVITTNDGVVHCVYRRLCKVNFPLTYLIYPIGQLMYRCRSEMPLQCFQVFNVLYIWLFHGIIYRNQSSMSLVASSLGTGQPFALAQSATR